MSLTAIVAAAWMAAVGQAGGMEQMARQPETKPAQVQAAQQVAQGAAVPADHHAEKLGWVLGAQTWTFRDRTTVEALRTMGKLGLSAVEICPGQKLSPDTGEAVFGPEMTAEQRELVKREAKAAGVTLHSLGVVEFGTEDAEKYFVLAKALGMDMISCEPKPEALDLAQKLAEKYDLRLAIHNHPKPSRYCDPATVAAAAKGRDRIGACADTGHWPRSGFTVMQGLTTLDGKIFELHFKDIVIDEKNPGGVDRPWGEGKQDAAGMLRELKRQGFKGVVLVEYEQGQGAELEANVAKCAAFFRAQTAVLAAEGASKK